MGLIRPISGRLLRWYDAHGRDLPWRKTRNPYKILVSEVMLQQTQVPRVLLFYKKWLRQFPNWRVLSHASNEAVVRAWSGLGYNRRALMLRDVARAVVENGVPKTEEEWRMLKGIGAYTAAALSILSQNRKMLPIDTNIRRVLGRVLLGKPYPTPVLDRLIRANGRIVLGVSGRHADVVQALFDLSTMVCKKKPLCEVCPLRSECKAAPKFLAGKVKTPKRTVQKSAERIHPGKRYPDRIYRGRILRAVSIRPIGPIRRIGPIIDPAFNPKKDTAWLRAMVDRLLKDGLVRRKGNKIML